MKDLAIHEVDIINHLFGLEAASVYATAGSISHDFEDYANIIIHFKDHRSAFIESNWLTRARGDKGSYHHRDWQEKPWFVV